MKLNLNQKSARRFRKILILFSVIGFLIGIITVALIPGFRNSVVLWISFPLILPAFLDLLLIGFYLIFLNKH